MENLEQKIINVVNEKLNDGTVEKLVSQYIEKGISDALLDLFSYGGEGIKLIEKKLTETMVPAIEAHDFNQYLTKLDTVLTEIVNATNLADNKKILENLRGLMKEPETKEIKLSEIFEHYCRHVAENVSTYDLRTRYEDGEPHYEHVTASMEVEHEDKGWRKSSYDDCIVKLTCNEDKGLNCQIRLYKDKCKEKWSLLGNRDFVDVNSLYVLSRFKVFLLTLQRSFVDIIMDREIDCEDDIEPDEKPE